MRLTTERLILRPWEDRDRAPMAAIHGDPHVRRFFPRLLTPEETNTDIDLAISRARANGFHFQAAELKETGELVGLIGIGVLPDVMREAIPSRPQVEIGWVTAERFWGRGLAPEGAHAWLDYAWSIGLPEVVAFTARVNLPSQRVMQKIGMEHDPSDDFTHPKLSDGHPLRPHVVYRKRNPALQGQVPG
ncbi:GNAT family N-acetyltransferase [Chelativorans salis]|uniref:GNAT family N-acetyltransferase n=1 Tax=Chelativorans salis TaxID=2978478 RepID=A0ABT2LN90_9HYPH|nr:GNAT family N-acetyltransferase [Chelativorans sp. EGI FJ00035]MCT7376025.1 GNAT family N-acetyltransferase [Chelativorans sp. EGI FJ00035]